MAEAATDGLFDVTERAAIWLGIPEGVVAKMPLALQKVAARERGVTRPLDWLTAAIGACEMGSPGEAVRLWRLLYVLSPFVVVPDDPA